MTQKVGMGGSCQHKTGAVNLCFRARNDHAGDTGIGVIVSGTGQGGAWRGNVGGIFPAAGLQSILCVLSSSPVAAGTVEACPFRGLLSCLPDASTGWPRMATTSSSGSSSSSPPGAGGQGSPLPFSEYDLARAGL